MNAAADGGRLADASRPADGSRLQDASRPADASHPAGGGRPDVAIVRIRLGAQLRRLREAAAVSPKDAAWQIRASPSKISRMENGRIGFKERDILDLLALYGVTDPDLIEGTLQLAAKANAQPWWAKYGDVIPGWFEPYLGLEAAAQRIRTYDLQFVHGLFQTPDYARAIITTGLRQASTREIDRHVTVRMRRQGLLAGPDAPRVWSILDEAALRRPVGGPGRDAGAAAPAGRGGDAAQRDAAGPAVQHRRARRRGRLLHRAALRRAGDPRRRVHRAAHRRPVPGPAQPLRPVPGHPQPAQRHGAQP